MNPGGLDRGGMWHYGNMISFLREKSGSAGLPPLRVEVAMMQSARRRYEKKNEEKAQMNHYFTLLSINTTANGEYRHRGIVLSLSFRR